MRQPISNSQRKNNFDYIEAFSKGQIHEAIVLSIAWSKMGGEKVPAATHLGVLKRTNTQNSNFVDILDGKKVPAATHQGILNRTKT